MKIIVAVKRVVDFNVNIRVKTDGSAVDTDNVKMSMNPFDEIAVEQAVRLREAGSATEVIAVSIGSEKAQDVIRAALAMGADRGILVKADGDTEPLAVAKVLKALVEKEKPQLVLVGKQAIDDDCNQTGQMLAALLGWSQGAFISKLTLTEAGAEITREVDGGLEQIGVKLPSVMTVDLRLNQPRYSGLPAIMKAKKKPLDIFTAADFGIDMSARLQILKVSEPPKRKAGIKVATVADLAGKLNDLMKAN